jgi:hypothetical protein
LDGQLLAAVARTAHGKNTTYHILEEEIVAAEEDGTVEKGFGLGTHGSHVYGSGEDNSLEFGIGEYLNDFLKIVFLAAEYTLLTFSAGYAAVDLLACQGEQFGCDGLGQFG